MGYNSAELWNNMGLCSFYSSQYHTALQFFSKAIEAATDDNMADVWYVALLSGFHFLSATLFPHSVWFVNIEGTILGTWQSASVI